MSATDLVRRIDLGGHVTELVLNRPDKLNAFDAAMRVAFVRRLTECELDPEVRVIIVRGEGRAFSVGADVSSGTRPLDATANDDFNWLGQKFEEFLRVWDSPKPVIAQIHGYCMGISTILAGCCDLALIAEDATLGWPKLPMGGGLLSPFWVYRIGIHKAKEMSFLVGNELSGTEAVQWGFFNRAVPADLLTAATREMASRIALIPSDLLKIKKMANNSVLNRMGFRETVTLSPAWDAIAYTTEAARGTRREIADVGVMGAIAKYQAK